MFKLLRWLNQESEFQKLLRSRKCEFKFSEAELHTSRFIIEAFLRRLCAKQLLLPNLVREDNLLANDPDFPSVELVWEFYDQLNLKYDDSVVERWDGTFGQLADNLEQSVIAQLKRDYVRQ